VLIHCLDIDLRHDDSGTNTALWTDCTEQI